MFIWPELTFEFDTPAVGDNNVCTAPFTADKYILEFAENSKNIIDTHFGDENEMNRAASVPTSSEMRNVMKKPPTARFSNYKDIKPSMQANEVRFRGLVPEERIYRAVQYKKCAAKIENKTNLYQ
ncbi:hypothetical protein TNCV_1292001 [Trichonephila clavipes]|nr:hypothetical protein TNCV_1292001 [Trichonephila clavipes]